MTPSLLLVPILSFALAAPAPPNDRPYAKVELHGQFSIEDYGTGEGPCYVVWVDQAAYELRFKQGKDLPTKEELEKLDGEMVLVTGTLDVTHQGQFLGKAPLVTVKTFIPAKK
jgi:hypothetical protein